ncbi:MAG TPA: hypothetical protein VMV45_11090 [Casimicrobiaceae bacterium]|nr:hypothetical protein [Casimicrobiaceae bacterium]
MPRVLVLVVALAIAGCQSNPSQEEIQAAKETIDCTHEGERFVIRFTEGEARFLMPDATRVILYQVPVADGMRYLNDAMELRGRGMDLDLTRRDRRVHLTCKPYELPPKN